MLAIYIFTPKKQDFFCSKFFKIQKVQFSKKLRNSPDNAFTSIVQIDSKHCSRTRCSKIFPPCLFVNLPPPILHICMRVLGQQRGVCQCLGPKVCRTRMCQLPQKILSSCILLLAYIFFWVDRQTKQFLNLHLKYNFFFIIILFLK